jgi:very-short-patch-repair endonuclease
MKIGLTDAARSLRHRSTDAERKLGFKFKRQAPRGRYVVDFLCVEAALAIEVDGSHHATQRSQVDRCRSADLERNGLTVLRFWNNDVLKNLDGVLTVIGEALSQRGSGAQGAPSSPQGERRAEFLVNEK